MSYHSAEDPHCTGLDGVVSMIIEPRERDLGEFTVRRVLPARERRMVGPFIFFDHMGPAEFAPGNGIQVRPHPHIGLATITYLFDGEILHRDSLGYVQPIRAGAVNLMTAGRGIVHSERAGDDLHRQSRLHGIQTWIALPDGKEECEPAFEHYPAARIPETTGSGATIRTIIGDAFGLESPVKRYSPTLYLDCRLEAGSRIDLPDTCSEIAAYVVDGRVGIDGAHYGRGVMAVLCGDRPATLRAVEASHVVIIGGEPVGERLIDWNFVSSTRRRIEQAREDWRSQRFDPVPGETEFIPLP